MLYAIGDIHGETGKLEELLEELPIGPQDRLVFLGDYVDRGPDPRGAVDRLIALSRERSCVFLMGNHESMFLHFLGWRGPAYFGGDAFLLNGGSQTLLSYGYFDSGAGRPEDFKLPPEHETFYRNLQLHHVEGDYLFVHAGLDRSLLDHTDLDYVLRRSRPEDLLWNRASIDLPHRLGVTIVYGHTPSPDFQVRWNPPFSVGIDTGAVFGGPLTALRVPDETLFQAAGGPPGL